jgi:hypothetical protein
MRSTADCRVSSARHKLDFREQFKKLWAKMEHGRHTDEVPCSKWQSIRVENMKQSKRRISATEWWYQYETLRMFDRISRAFDEFPELFSSCYWSITRNISDNTNDLIVPCIGNHWLWETNTISIIIVNEGKKLMIMNLPLRINHLSIH